jgi:glycosyltransferase involved in cell wall biosynthesis
VRILHISTRLILGGSQENTVLSCEGQARHGHEVHLAFGPIYGPEGSLLKRVQSFRTGDGRGITTHEIPHMIREINPRADTRARRELEQLIRSIKPDIVHTHSSKAGILGRAAAWKCLGRYRMQTGAPANWGNGVVPPQRESTNHIGIVHTIHGPPFMPLEGGFVQRNRIRLKNHLYTLAERYAAKRCHLIISVADAMTRQFLARGIGNPGQYVTVYSGMEVERYLTPAPGGSRAEMRARLGLADSDFVIGTVARLAEHKGHDDLLTALTDDLKAHPNWKLLWVGDGWWRKRLAERARSLGLSVAELDNAAANSPHHPTTPSPHILITGLIPPEEVPGHIRAMDLLAHPSYREGLPRTVPQALLCGVCPVAYDVDGTGEVCREGKTGFLVRLGDTTGLRAAVEQAAADPARRVALAARGREWCRDRFSVERMVADLEKVYARAVEMARAGK